MSHEPRIRARGGSLMSSHLTQANVARMVGDRDDPVTAGFIVLLDEINAMADELCRGRQSTQIGFVKIQGTCPRLSST